MQATQKKRGLGYLKSRKRTQQTAATAAEQSSIPSGWDSNINNDYTTLEPRRDHSEIIQTSRRQAQTLDRRQSPKVNLIEEPEDPPLQNDGGGFFLTQEE